MGKLQIDMLGTSFVIQSPAEEEYLKKLLKYYRQITDTIESEEGIKNPVQLGILAGITLVDELYRAKGENSKMKKQLNDEESSEAERLTIDMIEKIDRVLG